MTSGYDTLDRRIKTLLPAEYQETYEQIDPKPMRSAGLKYDADGQVAWDQIWGSFCDLAMAGGPPHKGALLEPASLTQIASNADRSRTVAAEICRGVSMVSQMPADPAADPGWVRVECYGPAMAGWLLRAITMENVAVRASGAWLHLPVSPAFRLDKEIKNVITVIAKTCHYWLGHMPSDQQRAIAELFVTMGHESPLIEPDLSHPEEPAKDRDLASSIAERIRRDTGLERSRRDYPGWVGVECGDVRSAVWMMRALVASNVLSRREETTLFVPVNANSDPRGAIVASAVARVYRYASQRGSNARSA